MRRVELFELIRRDYECGLSKREIARKRGVHRRTVRQALASSMPPERKLPERVAPKLTPQIKAFIDQVLEGDKTAPRKQRHTARRIWQRCTEERGAEVAESTVRTYVRARRRELGLGISAYVPQHHEIGRAAEADFYQADVDFPWGRETVSVIALRSLFSGASLHVAYPRNNQSALLEGLMLALEFLGGAFKVVRFDNLTEAVAKILRGGRRVERDRFIAFRSHYLFESSFCTPGIGGAHEKGGVEGEVGRFRRRHLTPVPKMSGYDELNTYLRACCIKDLNRTIENKSATVGHDHGIERGFLKPLPQERFEVAEISRPTVDSKCRVRVRTNRYSVPASLVGAKVSARLTPLEVELSYQGRIVAVHERLHLKNQERLCLDHYLELLATKPGAFPGALPLHQARERGEFPEVYDELWTLQRRRSGDAAGTCALIDVLLLHRRHPKEVVDEAVECAVEFGTVDPGTIALIARNLRSGNVTEPDVIDVGELSRYDRSKPDTDAYDALLAEVAQ
jgi:transposase